jgi:hypothetical protein
MECNALALLIVTPMLAGGVLHCQHICPTGPNFRRSIWHIIELTLAPKAHPPLAENPSLRKRGTHTIFFLICHN